MLVGLTITLIAYGNLTRQATSRQFLELEYRLPLPVQLFSTLGDRYLAANIATWRAIVTRPARMTPDMMKALADLQEDASWLNPGHEDNYYTATAILPWDGFVSQTQTILERATKVRRNDLYPPFFLGFNRMYFIGDYRGAAEAAIVASTHTDNIQNKNALTLMAAKWIERQDDVAVAVNVLQRMAKSASSDGLREHLNSRAARLTKLAELRIAARAFENAKHRAPSTIEELVIDGFLEKMPIDPLGTGYELKNGEPVLKTPTLGTPPPSP